LAKKTSPHKLKRPPSQSSESRNSSPTKKPKITDRYLNIKNILSDKEEEAADGDEIQSQNELNEFEYEDMDGEALEEEVEHGENLDDFDDASNWNDFDIETLNFDKFIKDHQVSSNNSSIATHGKKTNESGMTSSQIDEELHATSSKQAYKRKKDDKIIDPAELKAKRRVI
jgi:hypothetical protein